MSLNVLVADASDRRDWILNCVQQNQCVAVSTRTLQEATLALKNGSYDILLVAQDFIEAAKLVKLARQFAPAQTIIGLDTSPLAAENLGFNTATTDEAERALTRLLQRYLRGKRIRTQGAAVASRAAGLYRLNHELRNTNQRLSTVLESVRRLFRIADEERMLIEILQFISRYTLGAPIVFYVQRKEGLVPRLAMGVPPERLTQKPIAVDPGAWRGAKAFSTSLGEPEMEKNIASVLGTAAYFFLPLGNAVLAHSLLVVGTTPDVVNRAAIRSYVPMAALAIRQARRLRDLRGQAERDSLTGLLNHAAFQRILRLEVKRHQRMEKPMSVVMLDIDHFKTVNDEHGHPAGDRALKLLAETLRKSSRETDVIARYGGEEFIMLLSNTHRSGAEAKVQEMLQRVRKADWGGVGPITLSAGIAMYPVDGESPASLIEAADRALYAAKHGGRDRAMTYSEWLDETLRQDSPADHP